MSPGGAAASQGRVSPARAAAYAALLRLRRGGRLDDSVAALPELEGLGPRDRALANELVMGTVKRRAAIDAVLDSFTKAPLASSPADVREALRLAAFQLLFLDRVPAYAAVDDAVAMVGARRRGARGFANAVLRAVAREGRARFAVLADGEGTRAWAVRHSCPAWLVALLRRELGDETAERLLVAANEAPERCLRVNTLRGDVAAAQEALVAEGFAVSGVVGLPAGLLYDGPPLGRSAAFQAGRVTAQSRGSQVAGLVALGGRAAVGASAGAGLAILDLCAAPGTKTAQLAALAPGARITAVDNDERRLGELRGTMTRLGATNVAVVAADVLELPREHDGAYDAVLLDAPCSGLGTLSSRPDVRWRRRRSDIARLAGLQRALLRRAARCVRPGGRLTYAVCTLPRAETLEVAADLLAGGGGWTVEDLGAAWPELAHPAAGGYLLCLPPQHGATGFFIARFARGGAAPG